MPFDAVATMKHLQDRGGSVLDGEYVDPLMYRGRLDGLTCLAGNPGFPASDGFTVQLTLRQHKAPVPPAAKAEADALRARIEAEAEAAVPEAARAALATARERYTEALAAQTEAAAKFGNAQSAYDAAEENDED